MGAWSSGAIGSMALALALVPAIAAAQEPAPLGPTAVSTPPTAAPSAPTPAPEVAATPPAATPPAATPPAASPAPAATAPIGDPFRPGTVADTQGDPFRSGDAWVVSTPPNTTTTTRTTTTVVVNERVTVPPLPPPPPPSPPAPRRPFISGYGGLTLDLSTTSRRFTTFTGAHGGLLLGERLSIGASIAGLTRRYGPPIVGTSGRQYRLVMNYGGLELGAVLFRRDRFEFGIETMIGAGVACISRETGDRHRTSCIDTVRMAVVQPGAFIHLNLTNWMRVGLAGGYRFVARERWKTNADLKLAAPYFGLSLDFGWFRR